MKSVREGILDIWSIKKVNPALLEWRRCMEICDFSKKYKLGNAECQVTGDTACSSGFWRAFS